MTPSLPPNQIYCLPRPDRLYRRLRSPQRPTQSDRARAQTILAAYGLQMLGEPTMPSSPGRSVSLVFVTSAGKKLLKRYKGTVDSEAVRHEHAIVRRLADLDFPAPRLAETTAGETLVQHDGSCYALFDFIEGYFQYHHYVYSPAQMRRFVGLAGAALGGLHDALEDFTPAGRNPNGFISSEGGRWRELDWYLERLDICRRDLPALGVRAFAEQAAWVEETLRELDARLKAADLPRLIVHGDYGPYNLLFRRGAPVIILDFELARLDWRLTDLGTALLYFASGRLGFNARRAACLLEAYAARRPISSTELQLLPDVWQFLTLRRLIVCWHRCYTTRAPQWLVEAQRRLTLAHWQADSRSLLANLI